ncbi:S6 family peptidase [Akkermansia muciniphila]
MSDSFDVQTYRDFAENRGIFDVNAKDVAIYDKDGNYVGTIPKMMNFDGVADAHAGEAALVGGPGFIATVSHDYNNQTITFTKRFGATQGTPFYDAYRSVVIKNAWGNQTNYTYDYRVQRLSKIVTEAEYAPYLTDPEYLDNMKGRLVLRAGSGTQAIATGNGKQDTVNGAYSYLTGGTLVFEGQASAPGTGEPDPENAKTYPAYRFWYNFKKPTESNPLPTGVLAGDSGSPSYVFNENSGQWEWVGAGQSQGGSGYGEFSQMRSGNQWASDYVDSFNRTVSVSEGGGDLLWNVTDAEGNGTFVQGDISTDYIGLASGVRGDTSTQGTRATDAQIGACSNLVFDGSGGTIVLQGSVDTGAGSLTFNRDYVLSDGGDSSRRLNTAGFVVNKGATVTTLLTGASGDEWRKIGEGDLIVSGHGNNAADINVGGGGLLVLDRDGYAARNVKLNGGGVMVRLAGENQVSGEFIFGHRGGVVDMYGHNLTLNAITHLDSGAVFANYLGGSTVTFTFTGSGEQTFLGSLRDGEAASRGLMNVVYTPGTAEGSVWNLSGHILNTGTWTVRGGEVKVAGALTLHAGGYVDENDWQMAAFSTGTVQVNSGARFTTGSHSLVVSAVQVDDGGTYGVLAGGDHSGNVVLSGAASMLRAEVDSGSATESGVISGAGSLVKTGEGTLLLKNGNNSFSGTATVEGGLVRASSAGALGQAVWTLDAAGALSVDGAGFSSIAGKLDQKSSGTFVLLEDQAAISGLAGFRNLSIGAAGEVNLGTSGTTDVLSGWTADGGWSLGGGGGTLTVNLKLSGSGTLSIGNGSNTGAVVLANAHNSDSEGGTAFSGAIELNGGVRLAYTDVRSLGLENKNVLVKYGTSFSLGAEVDAALAHVSNASGGVLLLSGDRTSGLDLGGMGLDSVYIGADGQAVLSGSVTAGTQGYLFGGGTLTVASSLGGAHAMTVDTQGMETSGGVILAADNTYSGETRILSGAFLTVGNGGTAGSLGTGAVVNDGTLAFNRTDKMTAGNAISGTGALIQKGAGELVLTGNNSYSGVTTIAAGTLTVGDGGTSGSLGTGAVVNNGVLAFNRSDAVAVNVNVSGSGALVKNGSGTLTIQKMLSYTGGTTVNEGALVLGYGGANGMIRGNLAIQEGAQVTLKGGDSFGYSGGNASVKNVNITGGTLYFGDKANQTFQNTVFNLKGAVVDGVTGGRMDIWTKAVVNVKAANKASEIRNINVLLRDANPTVFMVERGKSASDLNVSSNIINSSGVKGSFIKKGAGIMVLSGRNTYSGGTTVNWGTLVAASNQALGTGLAAVNSGARLAFGGLGTDLASVSLGNDILVKSGGILSGSATLSGNTTLNAGSMLEFTLSMGGAAGDELAYNSLMLQSGVFQIDAGAKLKLAAVSLDYSSDFWGTSHILNLIEGGANASLKGAFTLDLSGAGNYGSYGSWSLQGDEDSKTVNMVWTPNAEAVLDHSETAALLAAPSPAPVPEPSSALLVLAGLGTCIFRRRVR